MHARFLHLSPAILLGLALAPSIHAATPGKACDLLPKATADTLFGGALKPGAEHALSADGTVAACFYQNSELEQVNFHFQIRSELPDTIVSTVLKTMIQKRYPTDVVEKIPGVGDDNFFITSVGTPNQDTFTVVYHKAFVTLVVRGSHDKNQKADIIQAMKQALTKF